MYRSETMAGGMADMYMDSTPQLEAERLKFFSNVQKIHDVSTARVKAAANAALGVPLSQILGEDDEEEIIASVRRGDGRKTRSSRGPSGGGVRHQANRGKNGMARSILERAAQDPVSIGNSRRCTNHPPMQLGERSGKVEPVHGDQSLDEIEHGDDALEQYVFREAQADSINSGGLDVPWEMSIFDETLFNGDDPFPEALLTPMGGNGPQGCSTRFPPQPQTMSMGHSQLSAGAVQLPQQVRTVQEMQQQMERQQHLMDAVQGMQVEPLVGQIGQGGDGWGVGEVESGDPVDASILEDIMNGW